MPTVIRIFPDMTFEETKRRTREDKIIIDKDYTPEFKIGTGVFIERMTFLKRLMLKRKRNLILLVDGAPMATHLEGSNPHPALAFDFGTREDTQKFLYKIVAKSKADQKPISNMQFTILAVLIGIVVVFQFMLMKGVTF